MKFKLRTAECGVAPPRRLFGDSTTGGYFNQPTERKQNFFTLFFIYFEKKKKKSPEIGKKIRTVLNESNTGVKK